MAAAFGKQFHSKKKSSIDWAKLTRVFPEEVVRWKLGDAWIDEETKQARGYLLAFIDARDVQNRLDEVLGQGGWQSRYTEIDGGFISELSIKVDGEWVTKSDVSNHTDEEPIKGAASRALCRAASSFGIGRYLYEADKLQPTFVEAWVKGSERIEIEGQIFYWVREAPAPKPVAQTPLPSPRRFERPSGGIRPHSRSRNTLDVHPAQYSIELRYGPYAGKRFGELNQGQLEDLKRDLYAADAKPLLKKVRVMFEAWSQLQSATALA